MSNPGSRGNDAIRRALLAVVTITSFVVPTYATADSYTGYSETAFDYKSKAACCEDAVAMAQEESARACERSGGYADFRRTSARGRCDWDTRRGSSGGTRYGCTATATVPCR
jgi:hypothetical protein